MRQKVSTACRRRHLTGCCTILGAIESFWGKQTSNYLEFTPELQSTFKTKQDVCFVCFVLIQPPTEDIREQSVIMKQLYCTKRTVVM